MSEDEIEQAVKDVVHSVLCDEFGYQYMDDQEKLQYLLARANSSEVAYELYLEKKATSPGELTANDARHGPMSPLVAGSLYGMVDGQIQYHLRKAASSPDFSLKEIINDLVSFTSPDPRFGVQDQYLASADVLRKAAEQASEYAGSLSGDRLIDYVNYFVHDEGFQGQYETRRPRDPSEKSILQEPRKRKVELLGGREKMEVKGRIDELNWMAHGAELQAEDHQRDAEDAEHGEENQRLFALGAQEWREEADAIYAKAKALTSVELEAATWEDAFSVIPNEAFRQERLLLEETLTNAGYNVAWESDDRIISISKDGVELVPKINDLLPADNVRLPNPRSYLPHEMVRLLDSEITPYTSLNDKAAALLKQGVEMVSRGASHISEKAAELVKRHSPPKRDKDARSKNKGRER